MTVVTAASKADALVAMTSAESAAKQVLANVPLVKQLQRECAVVLWGQRQYQLPDELLDQVPILSGSARASAH